ncbi:MAG: type II secretion system protein, partial [Bacilli bacterium]
MKKKKGFTLVELLAVIVILAVILVIAVPQIMSVIESARKGSIESTAKLIAEGAEREYTNRKILGKDTNVLCSDVSS